MTKSATREAADGELFKSTGIDDNATSTAVTIDASENVGIGVTPETWQSGWSALQIGGLTSYYAPTTTSASQSLMINNNAYNDGAWKYLITDEASSYYQLHGGHTFRVAPSGTADTAISWTTGFEVLADGKARAKNGLLFGTDTAAANALDDYEEGTWTPTINQGTTGFTYTNQEATYVKIGRLVFISFRIDLTGGTVDANQLRLAGVPFGPDNAGAEQSGITWSYTKMGLIGGALPTGFVVAGGYIYLYKGGSGSTYTGTNLSVANANIRGSMVYRTAE